MSIELVRKAREYRKHVVFCDTCLNGQECKPAQTMFNDLADAIVFESKGHLRWLDLGKTITLNGYLIFDEKENRGSKWLIS